MRNRLRRLEKRIVDTYEFWQNFIYYIDQGHRLRMAWEMAGNTLR